VNMTETGRLSPNSATHTNVTYCFLATGVERVAEPMAEDTERVETVLMPLTDVIELAKQGGLLQALHVGSLFFALHTLGELRMPLRLPRRMALCALAAGGVEGPGGVFSQSCT
jgi:ADP-ribose pyrophosphatase